MIRTQENMIDSTTILVTVSMCYYDSVDFLDGQPSVSTCLFRRTGRKIELIKILYV